MTSLKNMAMAGILLLVASNTQAATFTYSADNGTSINTESNTSVGCAPGSPYALEWGNHFTVYPQADTITHIQVAIGDHTGATTTDLTGDPINVFLYSDPNEDGNPSDAVLLATMPANGAVANYRTDTFTSYDIPDTTITGNSFFVTVGLAVADNAYPARFDSAPGPSSASWIRGDCSGNNWTQFSRGAEQYVNFMVRALADLPALTATNPAAMGETMGNSNPVTGTDLSINEAVTGLSCGFTDPIGGSPIVPSMISATHAALPGSADIGTLPLSFSCDASAAGYEEVNYSCVANEGSIDIPVSCRINALDVQPSPAELTGVRGFAAPQAAVELTALNNDVNGINGCGFDAAPSRISVVGSLSASISQGSSEFLSFECDTTTSGSESTTYSCDSNQGPVAVDVQCTVREPNTVEISPWGTSMNGVAGEVGPTSTVELTPGFGDVTNSACGFFEAGEGPDYTPVTPNKVVLLDSSLPDPFAFGSTATWTFACNTDMPGSETVIYGCGSDQGQYGLWVSCDISAGTPAPGVSVLSSTSGWGTLGGPAPIFSSFVGVDPGPDITNIDCQLLEADSWQPAIAPMSYLYGPPLTGTLTGGTSREVSFACDTSAVGSENLVYACNSDQGTFSLPVDCRVQAAEVYSPSGMMYGVRGNPPPSTDYVFSAPYVGLTGVSCFLEGASKISLVSGITETSIPIGEQAVATFSCDTSEAGQEWAPYHCDTDQGRATAWVGCDVRERNVVEPWPERAQFIANSDLVGAPLEMQVRMTAEGAPVDGINSCGFYDQGFNPVTPTSINLISGSFGSSLGGTDYVDLTFSCDVNEPVFEYAFYGCASNQGLFWVDVSCQVSQAPATLPSLSAPSPMTAEVGGPDPTTLANITTTSDLQVYFCAFAETGTYNLITPALISLDEPGLAEGGIPAGTSTDLTFRCDASSLGNETVDWGCNTNAGIFGWTLSCEIGSDDECADGGCTFMRSWRLAIPGLVSP